MLSAGKAPTVRRGGARPGSVLSRRGDALVSGTQRSRMLSSALRVIAKDGYGELSVARITAGAGVSRRTFYDLFEDREDCFLAVFEDALSRARQALLAGAAGQHTWREQIRAALLGLLTLLDSESGLGSLLVVDALKAGPRIQQRRVEILSELAGALHQSAPTGRNGQELPLLMGEGVVGAVLGLIHTHLLAKQAGPVIGLLNPLMGVIVLPYLGPAAAQRELQSPLPELLPAHGGHARTSDPLAELPIRITHRTLLVLLAIAEQGGASNRQVGDRAGVSDPGQISRLLARLQGLGLIVNNSTGQPSGEPNEWHLTPLGQQVQQAMRVHAGHVRPRRG